MGGSIYLTMPAVGYNASYASPGIKGGLILRGVGHRVGLALNGFLRAGDGAIWGGEINPFITFADLVDVGGFFLLGSSQDYHLSDPLFLEYGPMVQIYSPRVGVCRLGVYVRVAWVEAPRQMGDQGRHVEAGIGLLFF
ncbi:MAG: hypothetical protein A2341_00575 [Deltaproteobacteria bacterium RIFOXYB12_FULL_58_9]|nr:MAG: hypothetical protein A2341_00575 [Deltaproteobacteria bacterium RIFOXYB12_FULL_58_9]